MKTAREIIENYDGPDVRIMEVCGTHTHEIFRLGIRKLLPKQVELISGPGCPVCVTPVSFIDEAIYLALEKGVTICTFGDLVRVPGTNMSLAGAREQGAKIHVVYSPADAEKYAGEHPDEQVTFLSVGFETTTPAGCLSVKAAREDGLDNYSILVANKTMPQAYEALKDSADVFLYPGHVNAITGTRLCEALTEEGVSGVVAGFTAKELMTALAVALVKFQEGKPFFVNCYPRVVRDVSGRVTGVRAEKDGKTVEFKGRNVVLAAGGYGANLEMVKKYNNISVRATSNQPGATGEVIEEAVKAGAALEGMEWIQIHPHGNPKNGELESAIAGRPQDTPYVNVDGVRFIDETGRRDELSHAILEQPGKVVYAIFDRRTIDEGKVRADLMQSALDHGYAFKAETLADLANAAGIKSDAFVKTIDAYNVATRKQDASSLPVTKILFGLTVEKAPFYAVPITTTIHHTMGGIRINEKTQVLDAKGEPILGLYAAGEVTGGIHGTNRLGRNALTDLLVFGHIAGQEVSKK